MFSVSFPPLSFSQFMSYSCTCFLLLYLRHFLFLSLYLHSGKFHKWPHIIQRNLENVIAGSVLNRHVIIMREIHAEVILSYLEGLVCFGIIGLLLVPVRKGRVLRFRSGSQLVQRNPDQAAVDRDMISAY